MIRTNRIFFEKKGGAMDSKKNYKPTISNKIKTQTLKPEKKSPLNWPAILGVMLILAAIVILVLTLIPKEGKQKEGGAVQVAYDIQAVREEQKSVDEGHSPWKLDPVFVTQVFVSLKISPNGIQGDYPVRTEELKLVESSNRDAVVQVSSSKTPIKLVYLKRLVRKDDTGIWTVTAYETADANKVPENVPEKVPENQKNKDEKENIENKENKGNTGEKSGSGSGKN
jgi:hypothetical protein